MREKGEIETINWNERDYRLGKNARHLLKIFSEDPYKTFSLEALRGELASINPNFDRIIDKDRYIKKAIDNIRREIMKGVSDPLIQYFGHTNGRRGQKEAEGYFFGPFVKIE